MPTTLPPSQSCEQKSQKAYRVAEEEAPAERIDWVDATADLPTLVLVEHMNCDSKVLQLATIHHVI